MLGKILFVTSRFGGLPEGMINSLKDMKVDYLECPIWSMEEFHEKFQPQVTIFFHHFLKEFEEYVPQVQKLGGHKMYWDWECPWEIDDITKYAHLFGYILVQDKMSANALSNRVGGKVTHVPHAADPRANRPMEVEFDFRSDLCFIGAAYPSRLEFFREVLPHLKDFKVVLGGTGWEFLPDTFGQKIINNGVGADYFKYVNGAKVNLNLHRRGNEVPIANKENVGASSPNNRLFEVYATNSFQMTDNLRNPEIFEYYPDAITFDSPRDFLNKFNEWVNNKDRREDNAKKNYERTLEHHLYKNRFIEKIAPLI